MVDRMREKPGGDEIKTTIGDMSQVSMGRSYALVYLVYNTIGNLLTQDDQVRCFENAARHLTDDGVFVLECRVPTAPSRPGHQFVDAERIGLDNVVLEVGRYDLVTQILDDNHVHIGPEGIIFGPSVCDWPTLRSSISWHASPVYDFAIGGVGGTKNHSIRPAGATSASTSERRHDLILWSASLARSFLASAVDRITQESGMDAPAPVPHRYGFERSVTD